MLSIGNEIRVSIAVTTAIEDKGHVSSSASEDEWSRSERDT